MRTALSWIIVLTLFAFGCGQSDPAPSPEDLVATEGHENDIVG